MGADYADHFDHEGGDWTTIANVVGSPTQWTVTNPLLANLLAGNLRLNQLTSPLLSADSGGDDVGAYPDVHW